MKRKMIHTLRLLMLAIIATTFGGCNNEDDVIEIFTGKTWKLTFIAAEGSNQQFNFWGGKLDENNPAFTNSMNALAQSGNFTLEFVGTDLASTTGGTFNGRGVRSTISGNWTANGASNVLELSNVKVIGNETDALAKAFVTGLQNANRYSGDNQNLYIYYTENKNDNEKRNVKFMAFRPAK